VPPEHEWSNYGLAKRTLLDRISSTPAAVHRIQGERAPEEAADLYEQELEGVVPDLALLGLGPDGHAASIFPDAPTVHEHERRVVAAPAELEPFVDRVTMTIPAFASAPLVVFLVSGASKAEAARRAFAEPPSAATPASLIRSEHGTTVAILDRDAARELPGQ
jgi:6-phosphogluconolactonase